MNDERLTDGQTDRQTQNVGGYRYNIIPRNFFFLCVWGGGGGA